MTKINYIYSTMMCGIVLLASAGYAAAQQAAMATNPSGKPFFQSVKLNTGQKEKMDFSVREVGSVSGRVFNGAEAAEVTEEADQQGIGGVKVTLRSRDKGFENYALDQYTDEIGAYKFQDLRPGKYSIVIDPANLPMNFETPVESDPAVTVKEGAAEKTDASPAGNSELPAVTKRTISGIVFIDKDGDGKYKKGKDIPVEGAYVVIDDHFITSDSNGAYTLSDLPSGRVGLLVSWPKKSENTHVVLDLGDGPVTNRVVNIPMGP